MNFADLKKSHPEAAEAFERLLKEEQDGSVVPWDLDAWTFGIDKHGNLCASFEVEQWVWQAPDWIDNAYVA